MHPLCFRGVHFLWWILVIMDYFYYTYKHNHIDFSSHIYKVSTYHYNWHGETEILILLKGRIEMSCNSEVFTMEPLDTIIISPQVGHATLALEQDTTALVIHIGKDFFQEFSPLIVSIDAEGNNYFENKKVEYNAKKEEVLEEIYKHVSFIK